jgi:hypothetical protein
VNPDITPHHANTVYVIFKLASGANDARSDDTSRLKVAVAEWLNARSWNSAESNAIPTRLSAKGKEDRGYSNDVTGRLLCPVIFDWDDIEY